MYYLISYSLSVSLMLFVAPNWRYWSPLLCCWTIWYINVSIYVTMNIWILEPLFLYSMLRSHTKHQNTNRILQFWRQLFYFVVGFVLFYDAYTERQGKWVSSINTRTSHSAFTMQYGLKSFLKVSGVVYRSEFCHVRRKTAFLLWD